jgi:hypothetical protein
MRNLLKQKLRIKKLNASGIAHHALIAVLLISAFASFGAYRVFSSKAATNGIAPPLSAQGLKEDGCVPGEHKNDKNKCEAFVKIDKIKDECALYKLPYGDDNHRCRTGLCVDGYEKQGVNCVKKTRSAPTTPPTTDGGGTGAKTDAIKEETCKLLGRQPANATTCKRVCDTDAGKMLTKGTTAYCEHAVAINIISDYCAQLHRKWLDIGCARLPGQQDTNNAPQCLAGFPYYNANFTPRNGDGTKTDVCEISRNKAIQNEHDGILGGQPINQTPNDDGGDTPPSDPNNPNPNDDSGDANANYRIILYKEKEFKGDKLEALAKLNDDDSVTMTVKVNDKKLDGVTDLAKLPKGWNDKVKSYKILKGRWQLCEDINYEKGCVKPYASDPNVADGKTKKKVSSVQPFVMTVKDETVEETPPACLDGNGQVVVPDADGKCPDNSKLSCPETNEDGAKLELHNGECIAVTVEPDVIVPVDKDFKGKQGERKCELLGREWISNGNSGEHGCSIETCKSNKDGRPRTVQLTGDNSDDTQKRTDTVCISYKNDAAYAVKLDSKAKDSEKKCNALSRIWIEQVKLCAQVPNRKDKDQTIVKAEQCAGKKTTYYIFKENAKTDECFNPNYVQSAKGVAKSVGGSLSAALKQGPKAYCKVVKGGKYHWDNGKCVIDRHKCWNGQSLPVGQKCPQQTDQGPAGIDCQKNPSEPKCNETAKSVSCGQMYSSNRDKYCVPEDQCTPGKYVRGYEMVYNGVKYSVDHVCFEPKVDGGGKTYRATYSEAYGDGLNLPAMGYFHPNACNGNEFVDLGYKYVHPFTIHPYFGNNTLIITDGVCKR